MPISVIISNDNGSRWLKMSLSKNIATAEAAGITDVIVVDDASEDDTVDYIQTHFPQVRLLQNKARVGRNRSRNRGAVLAKHDILLFLDEDMIITEISASKVGATFDNTEVFALALTSTDSPYKNRGEFRHGQLLLEQVKVSRTSARPSQMLWVDSRAMFVSKEKFTQLDGFDPILTTPNEDAADLCYRAWKRGWSSQYGDIAYGHSLQKKYADDSQTYRLEVLQLRNKYLMTWKNITYIPYILIHSLVVASALFTFRLKHIAAILRAAMRLGMVWRYRWANTIEVYSDKDILEGQR